MEQQKERAAAEKAAAARQAKKRGKGNQPLMLGILVLVSGYLWLGQPAFLEMESLPPLSIEMQDASLRVEMSSYIQRIQTYQAENGSLPGSLSDIHDDPQPDWTYQVTGQSYTLMGNTTDVSLMYESSQNVNDFLGNALQVIMEGVS